MVKETSFKIFLTSGVTLTVKANEELDLKGFPNDLEGLVKLIQECFTMKKDLEFSAVITHQYKDEKGKDKTQKVKHNYYIPVDRISWYMLEEV